MKRPTEAFYSANLWEKGMGTVVVSRFKSSGLFEAGVFLLDVYCLGVKNGFFACNSESEYEPKLLHRIFAEDGRTAIMPACARKLIEDSVRYAQALGLAPHPDYKLASRVLGGISAAECTQSFKFGKDGKPFYIQGPNDSPDKAEQIIQTLRWRCGEGKFDYLLVGSLTEEFLDE